MTLLYEGIIEGRIFMGYLDLCATLCATEFKIMPKLFYVLTSQFKEFVDFAKNF